MTREDCPRAVRVGNYLFTGKVLGKGSFAVVEEAIHARLRVKVSVKTINTQKCNPYVLKHLKREADILRQVDHPHIMRLFETMKYGSIYYMATELVRGGDLCLHVQQHKGGLGESATRHFSRQIATTLSYLHGKGIVHRDLKLENIMLDEDKKNIKLVDFGLSNHWRRESPLKTLCGSPEYCAPELFVQGTMYGPQVDLWALGVIMFAMAVGQLPFPCLYSLLKVPEKKNIFIKQITQGLTTAHLALIKKYPPEFLDLVKGLMNPKWEERLTVDDLINDAWLSNKNHWATLQQESFDAYDFAKIRRHVCGLLEISEDRLKVELNSRPLGEIAGFYNITVHERSQPKKDETIRFQTKLSTRTLKDIFPMPMVKSLKCLRQSESNKSVSSRVWITGAAQKFNEVIKMKKPIPRSIHTLSKSSQHNGDEKSYKSNKNVLSDKNHGDWSYVPLIGPFKGENINSSRVSTPGSKSTDSDNTTPTRSKFKKKDLGLNQPLLPSKMKLKHQKCKLITEDHKLRTSCKV